MPFRELEIRRSALILEMGTLVFYALYILWIGMVVKAPVSVCFSIEVVYYSLLLLSSYYLFEKKQNGRIKRYKVHKFFVFLHPVVILKVSQEGQAIIIRNL